MHTHVYTHHTGTHTNQPCEEVSILGPSSGSFNLQDIVNREAVALKLTFTNAWVLPASRLADAWGSVAQRVG